MSVDRLVQRDDIWGVAWFKSVTDLVTGQRLLSQNGIFSYQSTVRVGVGHVLVVDESARVFNQARTLLARTTDQYRVIVAQHDPAARAKVPHYGQGMAQRAIT